MIMKKAKRSLRNLANVSLKKELIAPCGMDCGVCSAYLAYAHGLPKKKGKISHCPGCRPRNKACAFIKRDCDLLKNDKIEFCFSCPVFPCRNLTYIDARYKTKYGMSFIENLNYIKKNGLEKFLKKQKKTYGCPRCGDLVCIHNRKCYRCDTVVSWKE